MNEVPKTISPIEGDLLKILHCFLGRGPLQQSLQLIQKTVRHRKKCLSAATIALVEDSLRKGCTQILARNGWNHDRFLRTANYTIDTIGNSTGNTMGDVEIREGRLWERSPAETLALSYSGNTLELLMWLTYFDPTKTESVPKIEPTTLTLGDRFLTLLIYRTLRTNTLKPYLQQVSPFQNEPLFWMLYPDEFPTNLILDADDFSHWMTESGGCVLECLQEELTRGWIEAERRKRFLVQPMELKAIGDTQRKVLNAFSSAAARVNRLDLLRFLFPALEEVVSWYEPGQSWFRQLNTRDLRMAEREALYHSGLALLHFVEQLQQWQNEALSVGFYDENYQASQLWKATWEGNQADRICERARQIIQSMEMFTI